MNKTYIFEVFTGILILISTIFLGAYSGMLTGLILSLILFLPPFSYHLRSLDERELILTNKSAQISGHLLLIILAIMFTCPSIELGNNNLSSIWFPIALGLKIFMDGALSLYLFNNKTFNL